jgi:hypothetical protein
MVFREIVDAADQLAEGFALDISEIWNQEPGDEEARMDAGRYECQRDVLLNILIPVGDDNRNEIPVRLRITGKKLKAECRYRDPRPLRCLHSLDWHSAASTIQGKGS